MTDLDRLLEKADGELARAPEWQALVRVDPAELKALIERVKEAEHHAAKMKNPDDWIDESLLATERELDACRERVKEAERERTDWEANLQRGSEETERLRAEVQRLERSRADLKKRNERLLADCDGENSHKRRSLEVGIERIEAKLRAAEEVLRVVRATVDQAEPSEKWTLTYIENALQHYDKAVKE